jgi:hypothetical protein
VPYTATNWSTIRARLKDRYDGKAWWTQADARDAFNEGLYTYNLLTGRWKRRETLPTVSNQYLYTTSASMTFRQRLTFNNLPVDPATREGLNNGRFRWRSETTTSGGDVPTRPIIWAPISLNTFYIWPADAAGSNTLTLDGVAATPTLVEDGDTIDLGEEALNVLLDYALHVLTFSRGDTLFSATQDLFKQFLLACAEENSQIKSTQIFRRFMGWDRRDYKPLRGIPTRLDPVVGAGPGPEAM